MREIARRARGGGQAALAPGARARGRRRDRPGPPGGARGVGRHARASSRPSCASSPSSRSSASSPGAGGPPCGRGASASRARAAYAEELARLYGAYRDGLRAIERRDRVLHDQAALDALRLEPARWGATPVFLYGFDDLQPLQRDAVETLAVHAGAPVTVSLAYEPGRAAFAGRGETFQELMALGPEHVELPARAEHYERPALHALERTLFEPPAVRAPRSGRRAAAARGRRRARRARARRRARRAPDRRARPSRPRTSRSSCASRASTPRCSTQVFGELERPLRARAHRSPPGTPRSGAASSRCCAARWPAAAPTTCSTWLRTPGKLERPGLADRLEQRARDRGGGDARRGAGAVGGRPSRTSSCTSSTASRRRPATRPRCAGAWPPSAARCSRRRIAAAPRVLAGPEALDARVAGALRSALGELERLAAVDRALVPAPDELARVLHDLEVRAHDDRRPGLVAITSPRALRARRVRAAFLCGLREDAFPRPATPEPFLGDDERRALNAASGLRLRLREDRLDAERYLLYAVASRPTELLALSWPAADDEGEPCVRSLFVDDVLDSFDPRAADARGAPGAGRRRLRGRAGADRERGGAPSPGGGAGRARAGDGVAARRRACSRAINARADVVGVGARVLRLVPGEVVRRAPAAPGRARARPRADAARRPRPPRPGGHAARAVGRRPAHARAPRRGPRAAARRPRRARRRRAHLAQRRAPALGPAPAGGRPAALRRAGRPRALGLRAAGVRAALRRRRGPARRRPSWPAASCGCRAASTASTSAPTAARRSSTTTRARARRRRPSGSRTRACRSASTCSRCRSCSASRPSAGSTSRSAATTTGARAACCSTTPTPAWPASIDGPPGARGVRGAPAGGARRGAGRPCAASARARWSPTRRRAPTAAAARTRRSAAARRRRRDAAPSPPSRPTPSRAARATSCCRPTPARARRRCWSSASSPRSSRTACAPTRCWPSPSPRRPRASCARACAGACSSSASARRRARPRARGSRPSTASARGSCARTRWPPAWTPASPCSTPPTGAPRSARPSTPRWPTSWPRRAPTRSTSPPPTRSTACERMVVGAHDDAALARADAARRCRPPRAADPGAARAALRARVRDVRGRARRRPGAGAAVDAAREALAACRAALDAGAPIDPQGDEGRAQRERAEDARRRRLPRGLRGRRRGAAPTGARSRRSRSSTSCWAATPTPTRRPSARAPASTSTTSSCWRATCWPREPGIAAGYRERFERIMVDEFQDTNPLQLELLELRGARQRLHGRRRAAGDLRLPPRRRRGLPRAPRAPGGGRAGPRRWRPTSARARRSCARSTTPSARCTSTGSTCARAATTPPAARAGGRAAGHRRRRLERRRARARWALGLPAASAVKQAEARLVAQRVGALVHEEGVAPRDVVVLLRAVGRDGPLRARAGARRAADAGGRRARMVGAPADPRPLPPARRAGQPARRGGAARAARLADGRACPPTRWRCWRSARARARTTIWEAVHDDALAPGARGRAAPGRLPRVVRRRARARAAPGARRGAPARACGAPATTCTCSRCRAARGGWPTSTSCCAWRPPTRRAAGATCAASSTSPPPSSRPTRASPTRPSTSAASTRCG